MEYRSLLYNNMEIEDIAQLEHRYQPQFEFSLRSINNSRPATTADFSPLYHRKTKKQVSIIPTYNHDLDFPFATELDSPRLKHSQSHRNLSNKENRANLHIMVPKPLNNYCQICKQRYEDYLQHTSHPVHKKKADESSQHFSVQSLKEVLDSPLYKSKPQGLPSSNLSLRSMMSCSSKSNTSLDCSKLLQNTADQHQPDKLSIVSSQKCESIEEVDELPVKRREKRKYSNFRAVHWSQAREKEMDIQE